MGLCKSSHSLDLEPAHQNLFTSLHLAKASHQTNPGTMTPILESKIFQVTLHVEWKPKGVKDCVHVCIYQKGILNDFIGTVSINPVLDLF